MLYTINTETGTEEFGEFAEARVRADELTAEFAAEFQVTAIMDEVSVLAYQTSPVPAGLHFPPYMRIENPKFQAPAFPGKTPAYTRKRIQATVYRHNDKTGWTIHNGLTNAVEIVGTTKEACGVTKRMGQEARGV
jgi:hypothetical protein